MNRIMGVLTPAYGRVYKTESEATEAYVAGKDFIFHNPSSPYDGKYCSCRDFPEMLVEIRYGKYLEHATIYSDLHPNTYEGI